MCGQQKKPLECLSRKLLELRGGVRESRGQEAGEGGESASRTQLLLLRKDASAKNPEFSFLALTQGGSSGQKNSDCDLSNETGMHATASTTLV